MRKPLLVLTVLALLTGLVVMPTAAQDDEPATPSIADIVRDAAADEDMPEFTILLQLLQAADLMRVLDQSGPYTVLAPTDEAITSGVTDLGLTLDDVLADEQLLQSTLLYHLIPGTFTSDDLLPVLDVELPPMIASAYWRTTYFAGVNADGAITFGDATVVQADVTASNGVVHIIDTVLLPGSAGAATAAGSLTGPLMAGDDSIAELVTNAAAPEADPEFTILLSAVEAAGLVDALADGGPYTVFAPSDAAFDDFLNDNNLTPDDLLADVDTLTHVLSYHVVPWPYFAEDLASMNDLLIGTLLPGAALSTAMDNDGNFTVNGVEIITTDVTVNNGVIHVIDAVLAPPAE